MESKDLNQQSRREFLKFMGVLGLGIPLLESVLTGCSGPSVRAHNALQLNGQSFSPLQPTLGDSLRTISGIDWNLLIKSGDDLGRGQFFGSHNDYLALFPQKKKNEFILWSNHEYLQPLFITGVEDVSKKTKANVEREMLEVGGSLVHIEKKGDSFRVIPNSPYNRRITGLTPIPFGNGMKIAGSTQAIGTMANCAGGITPWKTVLTCEENYQDYYGDLVIEDRKLKRVDKSEYGWNKFFNYSPLHYGWIVEINPQTGAAKKHIALGRFSHEGATVTQSRDGRPVVYMGDDKNNACLYKFIGTDKNSLDRGTLYVASIEKGEWLPLDLKQSEILRKSFATQLDVLCHARLAAIMCGGTPLDRPEDIEISPVTGDVYVALTNNSDKGNAHGQLLRLKEQNNDPLSLHFDSSVFLVGGPESGFSCPDNLAFDGKGNLWMTSDISGSKMGKVPYNEFGSNGLFHIPLSGPQAGEVFLLAQAPKDAEFTGPQFSPDQKTLFLSVQHPGESTKDIKSPTSNWPLGPGNLPKSSVVTLQGPLLEKLTLGTSV